MDDHTPVGARETVRGLSPISTVLRNITGPLSTTGKDAHSQQTCNDVFVLKTILVLIFVLSSENIFAFIIYSRSANNCRFHSYLCPSATLSLCDIQLTHKHRTTQTDLKLNLTNTFQADAFHTAKCKSTNHDKDERTKKLSVCDFFRDTWKRCLNRVVANCDCYFCALCINTLAYFLNYIVIIFCSYSSSRLQKIPSHTKPATLHRPYDNAKKITKHWHVNPV